jgi:hypothetical protein
MLPRQLRPDEPDRFQHRRHPFQKAPAVERQHFIHSPQRRQPGAMPFGEGEIAAEGPGQDEDVAEEDRPIHAEPPNGLQRGGGGARRVQAKRDKICRFSA